MNADGSHQHQLTSDATGYRDYLAHYTADARRIVFARCKPNGGVCAIWIMRADGTDKQPITPYKEGANSDSDRQASRDRQSRSVPSRPRGGAPRLVPGRHTNHFHQ